MKSGIKILLVMPRCMALALTISIFTSNAGPFLQPVSKFHASFPPTATAGGDSVLPVISPDGRFVLFASTANNLALMTNGTVAPSIFPSPINVLLRDRASNTTTLVSVNVAGVGGGNGDSFPAGISTNGQFALFESVANNLIADDTNNVMDVFVRDLLNETTLPVSVSTNGGIGNGASRNSAFTPDGRFVVFVSAATNLVAGDTNRIPDVFVRDLQSAATALVSIGAMPTNASTLTSSSEAPEITPDGKYVVFYSTATNLVSSVRTAGEIYVRDLPGGTTTWVSTNARTIYQSITGRTNVVSYSPAISDDGRFVAFETSTNVPSFSSVPGLILRHDLQTGLTDVIHTNANVPLVAYENIHSVDMTPDGLFIAFVANMGNASATNTAVYLWDAQTGSNTLVSADTNGLASGGVCFSPVVSSNGQFVVFASSATRLVTNALVGDFHVFLRDLQAGTTFLVDADTNGAGAGVNPTFDPGLSADGRFVVFDTFGTSVVANDRNRASDVFVYDAAGNGTELISVRDPALPSHTANGFSGAMPVSVSADGRYVAFASEADDLIQNDTNGLRDVFVRDLRAGTNVLISADNNGFAGSGASMEPSISADGRYVAFTSWSTNFAAGDNNKSQDVFIRDLQTAATALVSVNSSTTGPGNNHSFSPAISADGRFVLFQSQANNLVAGSFSGTNNLFLRDVQLGTNYALTTVGLVSASMTPDGRYIAFVDLPGSNSGKIYVWDTLAGARISTNTSPSSIAKVTISPDGQKLATFGGSGLSALRVIDRLTDSNVLVTSGYPDPRSALQFNRDGRFLVCAIPLQPMILFRTNQVYVYDVQNQLNLLVSKGFDLSVGNGSSDSPIISADGRFVAYRSAATNIVAGDSNDLPDVFLYDQTAGTTTALSSNPAGTATANNRSLAPIFSSDGRMIFLKSWASDLVGGDFNYSGDVFASAFLYAEVIAGNPRTITWLVEPGQIYHLQFKHNVTDANWQEVPGSPTIVGDRAYQVDASPAADHRFYRVIAE